MKKITAIILSVIMLMSTMTMAAESEISVLVDGERLSFDVPPQIIDGRTMVPIRAIFEAMGAEVSWDDATKTAISTKDSLTVRMTVGSTTEKINNAEVIMDIAPVVKNDRTLAPARYVAEAFGYNVVWNGEKKEVIISSEAFDKAQQYENVEEEITQIEKYVSEGLYLEAMDLCSKTLLRENLAPKDIEYINEQHSKAAYYYDYYITQEKVKEAITGKWTSIAEEDKDDFVMREHALDIEFKADGTFTMKTWRTKASGKYDVVAGRVYASYSVYYNYAGSQEYVFDGEGESVFYVEGDTLLEENGYVNERYTYHRGWTNQ